MGKVEIDKERCKSCELCITFCNKECLAIGDEMNTSGYLVVSVVNADDCKGCGLCGEMCPDTAITVYK